RVDGDLAAGQTEGIRLLVLEDFEFPLIVLARRVGDAAAHPRHLCVQHGVLRHLPLLSTSRYALRPICTSVPSGRRMSWLRPVTGTVSHAVMASNAVAATTRAGNGTRGF